MIPIYTPLPEDGYCDSPYSGPGTISGDGYTAAPATASYVVMAPFGSIPNERVLQAGDGITIEDSGPSGTVTITAGPFLESIDLDSAVSGVLPVENGGTGTSSLTASGVLVANSSGTEVVSVVGTAVGDQLVWSGTEWEPAEVIGGVSQVTAQDPLESSDGATPEISLKNSGVSVGTYGSATKIPALTVTEKGIVSAASEADLEVDLSQNVVGVLPVSNGGTNTDSLTARGVLLSNLDGSAVVSMQGINEDDQLVWDGFEWKPRAFTGILGLTGARPIIVSDGYVPEVSLDNSGVEAGTYGGTATSAVISVDAKGIVTSVINVPITASPGGVAGGGLTGLYPNPELRDGSVSEAKILDGAVSTHKIASTGVFAGTYGSIDPEQLYVNEFQVNEKGQIVYAAHAPFDSTGVQIKGQVQGTLGQSSAVLDGDLSGDLRNSTVVGLQGQDLDDAVAGGVDWVLGWQPYDPPPIMPETPESEEFDVVADVSRNLLLSSFGSPFPNFSRLRFDVKETLPAALELNYLPAPLVGGVDYWTVSGSSGGNFIATSLDNAKDGIFITFTSPGLGAFAEYFPAMPRKPPMGAWVPKDIGLKVLDPSPDGTYGSETEIPILNIDDRGRVSSASVTSSISATKIQGRSVSSAAPTNGLGLIWSSSTNQWTPSTISPSPLSPNPAGVYGDSGRIPTLTVNDRGQVTQVTTSVVHGGDLDGYSGSIKVAGLQGRPLSSDTPDGGQVLQWNSTSWVPATIGSLLPLVPSPDGSYGSSTSVSSVSVDEYGRVITAESVDIDISGMPVGGHASGTVGNINISLGGHATGTTANVQIPVGGDLTGPLSAAKVSSLQGRALSSLAPTNGQVLYFNGTQWIPESTTGGAPSDPNFIVLSPHPLLVNQKILSGGTNLTISNGSDGYATLNLTDLLDNDSPIPPGGESYDRPGTYGNSNRVPRITVDAKGRIIGITQGVLNLGGDLDGINLVPPAIGAPATVNHTTVARLQGRTLSIPYPPTTGPDPLLANTVLTWNGSAWTPRFIDTIQNRTVDTAAPLVGDGLLWDGSKWTPMRLAGAGDVVGPLSAAADRIALFDGTTGKLIKQGAASLNSSGDLSGVRIISATGNIGTSGSISAGGSVSATTSLGGATLNVTGLATTGSISTGGIASTSIGTGTLTVTTSATINDGYVTGTFIGDGEFDGYIEFAKIGQSTAAAHNSRHAPGGLDALATDAPPHGIGAGNSEGTATSFARSDHDHTLRSGLTELTIGSISDGQFLKRVGTQIVGGSSGATKILTGNFSGTLSSVFASGSRWYPPAFVRILRVWASLGESTGTGVTEFDVLKGDGSVAPASILPAHISISAGAHRSLDTLLSSPVDIDVSEYITVSLVTANGGSNAVVFIEYE